MSFHVGGAADFILVSHDQGAITRDDQVGFHVVRTLLDGQKIAGQCVLGHISAGAPMRYDKWPPGGHGCTCGHENCARESGADPAPESASMQGLLARVLHRNRFSVCSGGGSPMNATVRRWRQLATVLAGLVAAGCASDPRPTVIGQPFTLPAV